MGIDLQELATRALYSPDWKWVAGMSNSDGLRLVSPSDFGYAWIVVDRDGNTSKVNSHSLKFPDLTDAATIGLLNQLIRWKTGDNNGVCCLVTMNPPKWAWCNGINYAQVFRLADTELEALILALESRNHG